MTKRFTEQVDELTTTGETASHVQKRIRSVTAAETFAARRVADGLEALIIEIDTARMAGLDQWPSTRGFEVIPNALVPGHDGRTRLILQLDDKRYRDVFRILCDDIAEVLGDARETDAAAVFHSRLARWQSFLQRHGLKGLSTEERCGLYGELYLLKKLLLPHFPQKLVVNAWRGYAKADQDFQFPANALEVKTTRETIAESIRIASTQQLDPTDMSHLFLSVIHVSENTSIGDTLPMLVGELRDRLNEDSRDVLDRGLLEAGFVDEQADGYSTTHYRHLSTRHFEIRNGFPRIRLGDVPAGVTGVRFAISLSACQDYEVTSDRVLSALRG